MALDEGEHKSSRGENGSVTELPSANEDNVCQGSLPAEQQQEERFQTAPNANSQQTLYGWAATTP